MAQPSESELDLKKEYSLPKALLCGKSEFFRKAVRDSREGEDQVIDMPHVRLKPFDMVIQYLYTGSYGPATSSQRVKDLVDVVLLIQECGIGPQLASRALAEIKELLGEDVDNLTGKAISLVYSVPQGHRLRKW